MKVAKDEQLTIVANLCIYKYKKHYNPRQIQEVNLIASLFQGQASNQDFPSCLIHVLSLDCRSHIWKKGLIVFREKFSQKVCL